MTAPVNPFLPTTSGPVSVYIYGGTTIVLPTAWTPWSAGVGAGNVINQLEGIGAGASSNIMGGASTPVTTYGGTKGGGYGKVVNLEDAAGATLMILRFALPDNWLTQPIGVGMRVQFTTSAQGGWNYLSFAGGGGNYVNLLGDVIWEQSTSVSDFSFVYNNAIGYVTGMAPYGLGGAGAAGPSGRGGAAFGNNGSGWGWKSVAVGCASPYDGSSGGHGNIPAFNNGYGTGMYATTVDYWGGTVGPPQGPLANLGGKGGLGAPTTLYPGAGVYGLAGGNGYEFDNLHGAGGGGGRADVALGTSTGGAGGYWGGAGGLGATTNGASAPGFFKLTYNMITNNIFVPEPYTPQLPAPPYTPPAPEAIPGLIFLKQTGDLDNGWNGLPGNPVAQQPPILPLEGTTPTSDDEEV